MSTTEIFLIAMAITFALPYLVWRLGGTDYFAPLVIVQILSGIVLGPGILGRAFPEYYQFVFNPQVVGSLNGIAWWAVMLFVWIAGIELDLKKAWVHRVESGITAGLALGVPMAFGAVAAVALMQLGPQWIGERAQTWQFIVGVGMSCAVTALPMISPSAPASAYIHGVGVKLRLESLKCLPLLWQNRLQTGRTERQETREEFRSPP